jgi:hypothetical protein
MEKENRFHITRYDYLIFHYNIILNNFILLVSYPIAFFRKKFSNIGLFSDPSDLIQKMTTEAHDFK